MICGHKRIKEPFYYDVDPVLKLNTALEKSDAYNAIVLPYAF